MNPVNWIALLLGVVAVVFCLQGAAQTEPNALQVGNLYEMKHEIMQQINDQIGRELHASISYMAMAAYFGQDNVSLRGFRKFFMDNSNEEKGHADKLVDYLNSRNGKLTTINVKMPIMYKGTTGVQALKDALQLENDVTKHLMALHQMAAKDMINDVHLADTLESDLLREQVESVRKLKGLIARLERMANGHSAHLAEYFIDQELYGKED